MMKTAKSGFIRMRNLEESEFACCYSLLAANCKIGISADVFGGEKRHAGSEILMFWIGDPEKSGFTCLLFVACLLRAW